jgi:peptidoglycan/LPS O-acetylase OafA/YrhL
MTVDQPKDGKAFYPVLDLLRFAAAALVMLNHLWVNQFDSFSKVACESSVLKTAFFSATRVGLEAVVVFFVLSGFLVGGASLARSRQGMPSGATAACRDLPERSTPYPDVSTKACSPRSQGRK